jgi:hypothetical protein
MHRFGATDFHNSLLSPRMQTLKKHILIANLLGPDLLKDCFGSVNRNPTQHQ